MRPIQCSKCGYDLAGLPGAGACPECGQRYWVTRGKGIGHASTAEARGSAAARKVRSFVLLGAAVFLFILGIVLQLFAGKQNAFITGAGVGGLLLLCAAISYGLQRGEE